MILELTITPKYFVKNKTNKKVWEIGVLFFIKYNAFNKYVIKTSEHTYNSQPIKPVEKQKVQVYKDEDESVQL